ncbi:GTP binding protein, putative [Babesia ovata]|uniref:GTP binding protein, putative n=1 Tax=Babesia ovata TaxID=189622 RepID=A0A2H6K8A9_9APIC|nr:GTP binding protein, putative [Babesia ovata]GBE59220.1 GTP binding protein, putative [Babesia ovata]
MGVRDRFRLAVPVSTMAPESQHGGFEYDLKSCTLPEGAQFIARSGGAYFFSSDKCQHAYNEQLKCVRKFDFQYRCRMASTYDKALALAARNRLYTVDKAGAVKELKMSKRLLHVHMMGEDELLHVLICRTRKMLQLQIGERTLSLEAYTGKCDCEVIFADFVDTGVFCLAYVNEGTDVKIALVAVRNGRLTLLRNDLFRQAKSAKMTRAIGSNKLFLIGCDGKWSVLTYDRLYCAMVLVRHLNIAPGSTTTLRLLGQERVMEFEAADHSMRIVYHGITDSSRVEKKIPLEAECKEILTVNEVGKRVAVLLRAGESGLMLIHFKPPISTRVSILFDNKLMVQKPEEELSELIRTGKVTINTQLVDHIMRNKLESCAIECLKSIYIPEKEAVRIIVEDTELLKVLIQHTKGDQNEMIAAIRKQVSEEKCAEIVEKLFYMLDNIDMFGDQQIHCYKRIIAFMNILLDAKLFQMQEAQKLNPEWIDKLQQLVQHCTTENHNLLSLLSFTASLLKSRGKKQKTDKSSLIVSLPISV